MLVVFLENARSAMLLLAWARFLAQLNTFFIPSCCFSNLLNLLPLLLCTNTSTAGSYGAIRSQVLALAEVTETDGQFICSSLSTISALYQLPLLQYDRLFPKLKPRNYKAPKASGKRAKVLYLSDFCRIPAT
jgi:hypothetical protein